MARRATPYHHSSVHALDMRARRAAEDPKAMTLDANLGRLAKHVVALHLENPNLSPEQIAKGARLRLKAEMAKLARRSAEARKVRAAVDSELSAEGLADAGSDGIDAD